MRTRVASIACLAVVALFAAVNTAHGGDWSVYSVATTAAPVGVTPVLYNLPSGAGVMFTQGRYGDFLAVDATITLTVYDPGLVPVPNVPATEMWLEKENVGGTGNFVACLGGTLADGPTNAQGVTHWVQPLNAGGWSTARTLVVINGTPLATSAGLVLRHNSADLNGDGVVNLADVPLFAADFSGSYRFRSDLHYDGVINLSDIPRMAIGIGAACP